MSSIGRMNHSLDSPLRRLRRMELLRLFFLTKLYEGESAQSKIGKAGIYHVNAIKETRKWTMEE